MCDTSDEGQFTDRKFLQRADEGGTGQQSITGLIVPEEAVPAQGGNKNNEVLTSRLAIESKISEIPNETIDLNALYRPHPIVPLGQAETD